MRKPIISIKLSPKNYAGLVNLGNRVFAALTGNASFTTPAVALTALQTAITAVADAIAVWGPRSNRGSHADLVDLQTKALTLSQLLKAESQYVETTSQLASGSDYAAMAAMMVTSGYQLANVHTPQGQLQMVQSFHRFISRKLDPNQVKLKWKKPLNVTSKNNVKSYRVLRGTTNVFSAAVEIDVVTRTSFVDTNSTGTLQTWTYWIVPVNTAGDGTVSDGVTVPIPAI